MQVLITGATGFIGSHLAEELHRKGYKLRCLVRKTSKLVWLKHLPIEYVYGDLFDAEVLRQCVEGVAYLYHVAGLTKAKTREEYFRGNHLATRNLLDAVREKKPDLKRFVLVSSLAAVGPSLNGEPVDETTPYHPLTSYGESKMEAEKECLQLADSIPVTVVRPPAVYGPRDKDIFAFFETMNKGIQPMIGFRDKTVSLIHVADLIKGIVLAGEHPEASGKVYFISSEKYYTWKEIGEITGRVMHKHGFGVRVPVSLVYAIAGISEAYSAVSGQPVLLNWEKATDIVQDAWTCSISKAAKELGFKEDYSIEEGIRNTVAWYRQEGWMK